MLRPISPRPTARRSPNCHPPCGASSPHSASSETHQGDEMPRPVLTPVVRAIPPFVPFVGPEAQERGRGRPFRARLGANESPFGPSPKAIAAMQAAAPEAWKYADPESHDLRHAIAGLHGVEARNVVVGEGIDGLLGLAVRLVTAPVDAVVTSDGTYPTFNFHVAANGGRLVRVP